MIRNILLLSLTTFFALASPLGAQAVGIGDKAPLFTASSDRGEVSLKDYLGEKYVIIAFYFAINTPA